MKIFVCVALLLSAVLIGCTNDQAEPESSIDCTSQADVSFATHIKPIIDGNCAFIGCHGAGSVNGVFTDYASLQEYIDNGRFNDEVIVKRTMPPGGNLDSLKYASIRCWVEANYPQ